MLNRLYSRVNAAVCAALFAATPCLAADVTWIGGSGTSDNWSDALNWIFFDRPDAGDSVYYEATPARTTSVVNQNYSVKALVFQYADTINTSSAFTINGTGALSISQRIYNRTDYTQVINVSLTFSDDATLSNYINGEHRGRLGLNFINTNGKTISVGASTNGISLGGEIVGSGEMVFDGPGTTEFGMANPNWTGDITLRDGTLSYSSGPNLGAVGKVISFKPQLNGQRPVLRRTTSGVNALPIDFNAGEGQIAVPAGLSVTHSGPLYGPGDLAKTESGVLTLTGNTDEFVGRTFVRAGTLVVGGQSLLPNKRLDISTSAIVQYQDGKIDRVGQLSGGGTLALGINTQFTVGKDDDNDGGGDFTGQINGTNIGFTKGGTETLTLTGSNAYSGTTTIRGGTLLANNVVGIASATGASSVTVLAGGTLGGDGRVAGGVTVQAGGALAPRHATAPGVLPGSLRVGSLALSSGSTTTIEIPSSGNIDALESDDALVLAGTLNLIPLPGPAFASGASRSIIHSNDPITGKFGSIAGVLFAPGKGLAVTYNEHRVFVTVATAGDATLDGVVNFDDLLIVAQRYGSSTPSTWLDGDFDGSGRVVFDDLLVLAQNYSAGGLLGSEANQLGSSFASDFALARSLVPEPAWLSMWVTAAMFRRRR